MSPATRTEARPTRARRAPEPVVRVVESRRVWWWALGGVALVVALAVGAAWSPLLDVETVEVVGVAGDRAEAVRTASGVDPGDPILAFLPGRAAGQVRDLAWVEDARVTRTLPDRVRIEVVPRVPVGWTAAGSRVLVVDGDGRVIERLDAPPVGVPELAGVTDVAPVGGRIAPAWLPAAAAALGPELRTRVGVVTRDDRGVTAQLANGPQLRFGTPDRLVAKARVAAAVLASLGPTPAAYVDVSVPAAPVSG